jgi:hypothetical protein
MATEEPRIGMAPAIVSSQEPVIVRAQVIEQVAGPVPAAESLAIAQAEGRAQVTVQAEALVLPTVLGEVRALVIVPAEEVQAPIIALAEVREPETVPVEAVLVRSHLRARLAVPLRTKSVIGPRRRDQVLLHTVEDLAAEVVETTHGQAAAGAVTAWEAAAATAVAEAPE